MMIAIGIVRPIVTVPMGSPERVHHDQREHGDQHDHDPEGATSAVNPATGPISSFAICPSDSIAASGGAEDHAVLHRAAERDADDDPDGAGEESELRRERRADERPRPGDRREVLAEDDPFVGRHEIAAVLEAHGGRRACGVERETFAAMIFE